MPHRTLAGCEVMVDASGVDVALVTRPGESNLLVLSPAMSFDAAVRGVLAVSPHTLSTDAERLVRTHLPDAVQLDLDTMVDQTPAASAAAMAAPPPPEPVWRPAASYAAVAGIAVSLVAAMGFSSLSIDTEVHQLRGEAPPRLADPFRPQELTQGDVLHRRAKGVQGAQGGHVPETDDSQGAAAAQVVAEELAAQLAKPPAHGVKGLHSSSTDEHHVNVGGGPVTTGTTDTPGTSGTSTPPGTTSPPPGGTHHAGPVRPTVHEVLQGFVAPIVEVTDGGPLALPAELPTELPGLPGLPGLPTP